MRKKADTIRKGIRAGGKRAASLGLALVLGLSLCPFSAYADGTQADASQTDTDQGDTSRGDASTVEKVSSVENLEGYSTNDIFKSITENKSNSDYDAIKDAKENPYGYQKEGEGSSMGIVEHELLLVQSRDDRSSNVIYDTYDSEKKGSVVGNSSYIYGNDNFRSDSSLSTANGTYKSNFASAENTSVTSNYSTIRAVAFNPTGGARDQCVAYVGIDYLDTDEARVVTWMTDFVTKQSSQVEELGRLKWDDIDESLCNCEMLNFMSITAGDYNGDGKDTVVVYYPGQGSGKSGDMGLVELTWTEDDAGAISLQKKTTANNTLIHPLYASGDGGDWQTSEDIENKLGCTLDTGDLDGDGFEDLAVLTYMGCPDDKDNSNMLRFVPYLAVSYGAEGEDTQVTASSSSATYVEIYENETDNYTYWGTPRSPGMSLGDANGDGKDDIAIAGMKCTMRGQEGKKNADAPHSNSDPWYYYKGLTQMFVGIYSGGSEKGLNAAVLVGNYEASKWKQGGAYGSNVFLPRSGVEFVAINGNNSQESLFIDGIVYSFQEGSYAFDESKSYTAKYFDERDRGVDSHIISDAYIQSVVAGNFDGNSSGREQLMVLVGLKTETIHNDSVGLLAIGGVYDNDKTVTASDGTETMQYASATGFYYSSFLENPSYLFQSENSDVEDNFSCELVALDVDQDGLELSYTGVDLLYSNAQVDAVLQAAPSFAELGQSNGSTNYKVTGSYSYKSSYSATHTHNLGGVIASTFYSGDGGSGVGYSFNIQIGKRWGTSSGTSTANSTTYTATFTATKENTVILRRSPLYQYNYKVKNSKEEDGSDRFIAYIVAQAPIYTQISVEDYNAIVDDYNAYLDQADATKTLGTPTRLAKIEESSLLANEGNPWKYKSELGGSGIGGADGTEDSYVCNDENGRGVFTSNPTWVNLTKTAGNTGISLSSGTTAESFWSSFSGINVSAQLTLGWRVASIGIYYGYNFQGTYSGSVSNKEETGIGTAVSNIDKAALIKENAAAAETIDAYGFQWALAGGKIKTGENAEGEVYVPLLHHIVKDVTAPLAPVTLTKAEEVTESNQKRIKLTWTLPEDDNSGRSFYGNDQLQYRIYQKNQSSNEGWIAVTQTPVEGNLNEDGSITYTFTPGEAASGTLYTYAVRCSLKAEGEDALESINSNSLYYVYLNAYTVLSAFDLAKMQGYEGDLDEWLESLKGESAFDLAVNRGYKGTEEEWLESLKGKNVYEIYIKEMTQDKVFPRERWDTVYGGKWYGKYLEALRQTDENITPLSQEDFRQLALKKGGAYGAYASWNQAMLSAVCSQVPQDQVNEILNIVNALSQEDIERATQECETTEQYAQQYLSLLNEAAAAVCQANPELSWTELTWDEVGDNALSLLEESLPEDAVYQAYEATVLDVANHSNILTEDQMMEKLKGNDGLSAYELAVASGYTGSQEEWLQSLSGVKGDKGDTGAQGEKGDTGASGLTWSTSLAQVNSTAGTGSGAGSSGANSSTGSTGSISWGTASGNTGSTGSSQGRGAGASSASTGTGSGNGSGDSTAASLAQAGDDEESALGEEGKVGRGIASVKVDENGHLIVTYTDDTTEDAGAVWAETDSAAKKTAGRDPLVYVALVLAAAALAISILRTVLFVRWKKQNNL